MSLGKKEVRMDSANLINNIQIFSNGNNMGNERNYGIDALRIIAMFMIVILHTQLHGGLLNNLTILSPQYISSWLIEVCCYGGINLFALITGFIGIKKGIEFSRLLRLWVLVFFYSVGITFLFFLYDKNCISNKIILSSIMPIIRSQYWYMSAYFGMIIFIPLINIAVINMPLKEHAKILFFIFVVYVTIPCLTFHSNPFDLKSGHSAYWLLLLYYVGAVISNFRIYDNFSIRILVLFLTMLILLTWGSNLLIAFWGIKFFGTHKWSTLLVLANSPTILLARIAMLMIFAKITINKKSLMGRIVSTLAPATLGVYLIHEHPLIREYCIKGLSANFVNYTPLLIMLKVLFCALAIYLLCTIIDLLRSNIFKILRINSLCDRFYNCFINSIIVKISKYSFKY